MVHKRRSGVTVDDRQTVYTVAVRVTSPRSPVSVVQMVPRNVQRCLHTLKPARFSAMPITTVS